MMRNAFILLVALILAMTASLVSAAQTPSVTILSPKNGALISGGEVEISVAFSSAAKPVTRVEVNLDSAPVTEQTLGSGQAAGECGFLWDTIRTPDGSHRLDVQIYSGKVCLGMTTCVVTVANKTKPAEDQQPGPDIQPPQAKITSPAMGETVSGKVPVIIQANDNSGKSPYVSVFVDKSLKAVTNHEPYMYTWDSSEAENGPHEINIAAMDEAENRTVSAPVRIIVRNSEKVNTVAAETPAAPITETAEAPAPRTSAVALPDVPKADAESGRALNPGTDHFEIAQTTAAESGATHGSVVAPPTHEAQPVLIADAPEPEVAVLVSGPTEVTLPPLPKAEVTASSAENVQVSEPKPETKPVQVAAALPDEPKKPAAPVAPKSGPKVLRYTVRAGDALYTIAHQFGTSIDALVEANGIEDPSLIRIGQKLEIPGRAACSVMVPLRPVFQAAGGTLGWDQRNQAVHAWAPGTEVRVWIGSARAEVNDQKVVMEKPAALKSGRTMVPQSFVTDTLGMKPAADK